MRQLICYTFAAIGLLISTNARTEDLDRLARQAISPDSALAPAAIDQLRRAGPQGLEALFAVHHEILESNSEHPLQDDKETHEWQRLRSAIDAVGAQQYCHTSRLYWYTNFDRARDAARREGKPILSLRLLGRLTDEYSCANSRFFRAVLYANEDLSRYLRERFILHWSSERPVPVVTVDFGDGRKLKTTLTGNSIHYVLDSKGRPVDALPGLYGPRAFRRGVERAAQLADQLDGVPETRRQELVMQYHRERLRATSAAWQRDRETLGMESTAPRVDELQAVNIVVSKTAGAAPAKRAMQLTAGKGLVETPLLRNVLPRDPQWITDDTTPTEWLQLARLHASDALLDEASRRFMRRQQPQANRSTWADGRDGDVNFDQVIEYFQRLVAVDSVRNEYTLHRQLHEWMAKDTDRDMSSLNERVYAELFLTPSSDPWLGLLPRGTYPALANYGLQR